MPRVPERVGRYEIVLPLGSGGMGTVYLARARGMGGFERELALKVLHAHLLDESDDAKSELLDEAWLAARLKHPNVATVIDVGEDVSGLFLVMEYVEGDTLSGVVKAARSQGLTLPTAIALRILVDALSGLQAAHELRDETGAPLYLVHRDFSPQNILVGVDGFSRLTDFGIAKSARNRARTQSGIIKGKPGYMAPEQALGLPLDRRCDVWAAAAIAWELFSGKELYSSESGAGTLLRIVSEDAPLLRSAWPAAPPALERCIAEGLRRDRDKRLATAEALRSGLLAAAGGAPAESGEVAAFISSCIGPKIEARRLRAANRASPEDGVGFAASRETAAMPRVRPATRAGSVLALAGLSLLAFRRSPGGMLATRAPAAIEAPGSAALPAPVAPSLAEPWPNEPSQAPRSGGGEPAVHGAATEHPRMRHGGAKKTAGAAATAHAVSHSLPLPSAPPPAATPLLEDSLDSK